MKFPAIVAALVLLECVVALPTPPPLKPTTGAPGGKTAGNDPQGRTGVDTNKNVQENPTSTAVNPAAVSPPAAKAASVNPTGLPASSSVATKQLTETSLTASGNTATSAEKSSTPTAKSSPNPSEATKAAGTIPQSRTSDQPLPKNVNPTVPTATQTTTQSSTSDHSLPKSVNPTVPTTQKTKQIPTQSSISDQSLAKSLNPTVPTTQTTKQTITQSTTSDQPLAKRENPTAATAQTTKPSVGSQSGSVKPKRAVMKPVEFARPSIPKPKAPLDRPVGHLPESHPTGPAARTEPTHNSKKSLPRTNAAFRAASTASRRDTAPTEKSVPSLPKASEPSRRAAPHSQATTKTGGAARDNRDGAGKVEDNARPARAVIKPQLSAKPKESRGAITKAPTKTTTRPALPEKDHSHATEGKVEVSKHKRPTRAALPPSTQTPQVNKEISTTQGTVKPSGKDTAQLPLSVGGASGKNDALPEPTVNLDMKAPTSISDVLSEMVKALISTSEITTEGERSAAGNSNHSGGPQSTDTVKTTPPTSTTKAPVNAKQAKQAWKTPASQTTGKPSYQADSSVSEVRIIPGQDFVEDTIYRRTTASPVMNSASTVRQLSSEKSVTKSVTSSPTTHSPVGKSTEIPSTTIKIP